VILYFVLFISLNIFAQQTDTEFEASFAPQVEKFIEQRLEKPLSIRSEKGSTVDAYLISCASLTPDMNQPNCQATCDQNNRCTPKSANDCLVSSIDMNTRVAQRAGRLFEKVFNEKFVPRIKQMNRVVSKVHVAAYPCLLLNEYKEKSLEDKCPFPTEITDRDASFFRFGVAVNKSKSIEEYKENLHKMMNPGNELTQDYLIETQVIDLMLGTPGVSEEEKYGQSTLEYKPIFYLAKYQGKKVMIKSRCQSYSIPSSTPRSVPYVPQKKIDSQGRGSTTAD
jgi:hypothetical protein